MVLFSPPWMARFIVLPPLHGNARTLRAQEGLKNSPGVFKIPSGRVIKTPPRLLVKQGDARSIA
jgi:hypothetical protein